MSGWTAPGRSSLATASECQLWPGSGGAPLRAVGWCLPPTPCVCAAVAPAAAVVVLLPCSPWQNSHQQILAEPLTSGGKTATRSGGPCAGVVPRTTSSLSSRSSASSPCSRAGVERAHRLKSNSPPYRPTGELPYVCVPAAAAVWAADQCASDCDRLALAIPRHLSPHAPLPAIPARMRNPLGCACLADTCYNG
jgi:hypothetical protein